MKHLLLVVSLIIWWPVSDLHAQTRDTIPSIYVREVQTYTECGLRKMDWVYVTYVPYNPFWARLCGRQLQRPQMKTTTNYFFFDNEYRLSSEGRTFGLGLGTHGFRRKLMLEVGFQRDFVKSQNEVGVTLHKTILFRSVHDGRVKLPLVRLGAKLGWLYGEEGHTPLIEMQLATPTFVDWLIVYGAYGVEVQQEGLSRSAGTLRLGLKYFMYGKSGTRILKGFRYRSYRTGAS